MIVVHDNVCCWSLVTYLVDLLRRSIWSRRWWPVACTFRPAESSKHAHRSCVYDARLCLRLCVCVIVRYRQSLTSARGCCCCYCRAFHLCNCVDRANFGAITNVHMKLRAHMCGVRVGSCVCVSFFSIGSLTQQSVLAQGAGCRWV